MSDIQNNTHAVRDLFVKGLLAEKPPYPKKAYPKLYPSDAGSCSRAIMLRVLGAKGSEFPVNALEAMDNGVAAEDQTLRILQAAIGAENVATQVVLQTDQWSGKADFVLYHQTEKAVIVEHKATGQKWFDYKSKLPEYKHVIQLALYKDIYKNAYGFTPELRLYYRAWTAWAEFLIIPTDSTIEIKGWVNGEARERTLNVSLKSLKNKLEWYWKRKHLPSRVKHAEMEDAGCTSKGKPWCRYHDQCWPKELSIEEIQSE